MASLTIDLLGAPRATLAGLPLDLRVRKELALLAYLALEARHPHRRDHLLGLLWPDLPEEAARNNLRVALARLRRVLGDAADTLLVDRQLVQFVVQDDTAVDVLIFCGLLDAVRAHTHAAVEECAPCVARLAEATERFHGEFLAGFSLPDSAPFEEWATIQRERLHQQQLEALDTLTSAAERRGEYAAQCGYARRQLALEPWRESAHAQLMRGLWASGQRGAAIEQFEICRRMLADELGLTPSPELTVLADQLRVGEGLPTRLPAPLPVAPAPSHPDIPVVPPLYGRDDALAKLERWLVEDRCRLVGLLGIGGVGKTTLAAAAAAAVTGQFDAIAWRSLVNAPPLDELVRDVLGQLLPGTLAELPPDPAGQIGLLLTTLRGVRCLLVLDNLESLLRADEPGAMRPGYEGYAQLLRAVAERPHQSCVLLTSRERPQGLALLEEDTPLVRLLRLDGLDADAGAALLAARGLRAEDGAAGTLARRYSGNPLALRLVAQTVREVFDGDIGAFLETDAPIFDDISAVLDQQLDRLTPLERELLVWLAVLREPTPVNTLRGYLARPEPARAVVEAARGLLRRSLVAQSVGGLALQNVVTEYLTDRLTVQIAAELDGGQLDWLHRFALLTTDAPEYVRQSQLRLLVEPVAQRLAAAHGLPGVDALARRLLDALRAEGRRQPSYAAGTLLNLLTQLQIDIQGYDFSGLCVWQADLRDVAALDVSFAGADFAKATFSDLFDAVNAVAISPDGALVAAGSNNGVVGVWRVADGQRHQLFTGHTNAVWSVAWSPDGALLASAGSDGTVQVWDIATGRVAQALREGRHVGVTCFVPETALGATAGHGRQCALLATCDGNGCVRIWRIADGALLRTFGEPLGAWSGASRPREIGSLTLDASGARLATCAGDGCVRIWRIADGALLHTFGEGSDAVRVAFGPGGQLLATGHEDGTLRVWDAEMGKLVRVMDGHGAEDVYALAWRPGGDEVALGGVIGGADSTIRIWDVASGRLVRALRGHRSNVNGLAWSRDGALLASAGHDHTVRLWSGASGDELRTLRGHAAGVMSLAFGSETALASTQGHVIHIWDVPRRRVRFVLRGHDHMVSTIVWSRDGGLLASVSLDGTVRVWDVATRRTRHVIDRSGVAAANLDPAGRLLALGDEDGSVEVWEVERGRRVWQARGHTRKIEAVCFSPDGGRLYSAGADGAVRVWDAARGRAGAALRAPDGNAVLALAASPDGLLLACAERSDGIVVYDLEDGASARHISGAVGYVGRLAWSRDGRRLASSGGDRFVRLWERDGWSAREVGQHTAWISAVTWSPNGALLASSSTGGEIALWDGRTGAQEGELRDDGPYTGMDITGATGITAAQRTGLVALGAIDGSRDAGA
jgi:WD40 repeat protein/DNA-binding SARP family transcriptional activator